MYSNNKEQLELTAQQLAQLVWSKGEAYGDSITSSKQILKIFYPTGISTTDYDKVLIIVRVIDKLQRIVQGAKGQENPWRDVAGYALRMLVQGDQNESLNLQRPKNNSIEGN